MAMKFKTKEENISAVKSIECKEGRHFLDEYEGMFSSLRSIAGDFKTVVTNINDTKAAMFSLLNVIQGKPVPYSCNLVSDEWFAHYDMLDENFCIEVGKLLVDDNPINRLTKIDCLISHAIEELTRFRSKADKMRERVGMLDKKSAEYQVYLVKIKGINATVEILCKRIDFLSGKFITERKSLLNRVLGITELVYGKYFDRDCHIDDGTVCAYETKSILDDIARLDDRMIEKCYLHEVKGNKNAKKKGI